MSYSYRPTPIEEAYGEYLLENVFQISNWEGEAASAATAAAVARALPPSFLTAPAVKAAVIRISGRQAVPFFTRSGVDRTILRNVWSFVDPHNLGYLDDPSQFHTSLRLIALAQSGLLQPYLLSGNSDGSSAAVATAMDACLRRTQDQSHANLPEFEGMSIPDASYLLHRYQKVADKHTPLSSEPSHTSGSAAATFPNADPFATTFMTSSTTAQADPFASTAASFPAAPTYSAPSPATSDFGGTDPFASAPPPTFSSSVVAPPAPPPPVGSPAAVLSISDAFGDLVEVDDKPLPALVLPTHASPTGAAAAVVPPGDASPTAALAAAAPDEASTGAAPAPAAASMSVDVAEGVGVEEDGDDDFGDFFDPTAPPSSPPTFGFDVGTCASPSDPHASAAKARAAEAAAPAAAVTGPEGGLNDSSEFGDFCGSEEFGAAAGTAPTSELQSVPASAGAAPAPSAISFEMLFPDLAKAAAAAQEAASASTIPGFGVELSDEAQEFLHSQPAAVSAGDWDALDALAEVPDAPLPSLAVATPPTDDPGSNEEPLKSKAGGPSDEAAAGGDGFDDDDFGDFVAISSGGNDAVAPLDTPVFDSGSAETGDENLGPADSSGEEDPTPTDAGFPGPQSTIPQEAPEIRTEDESDGFGDFVGIEDAAAVAAPQETLQAAVVDETAVKEPVSSSDVGTLSHEVSKSWDGTEAIDLSIPVPLDRRSSAPTPGTQGWGAFDALGLGPRDAQVLDVSARSVMPSSDSDSAPVGQPSTILQGTSFDAFDDIIGAPQDSPLPSQSRTDAAAAVSDEPTRVESKQVENYVDVAPSSSKTVERGVLRMDDRQETEFYSVSGSASEGSDGFQSAAESEGEVVKADGERTDDIGDSPPVLSAPLADTAIDSDDPFAALDALSSPPPELPPLSSFGAATCALDGPTYGTDAGESGFTSSVAFTGSLKNETSSGQVDASESDTFGDFESAEFEAPAPVVVDDSELASTSMSQFSEPVAVAGPDDSFGAFESVLPANPEPGERRHVPPAPDAAMFDAAADDDFQAFESSHQVPVVESQPADADATADANDDDGFGDFTTFQQEAPMSQDNAAHAHVEATDSSWDDFQEAAVPKAGPLAEEPIVHDPEQEKLMTIRRLVVESSAGLPESIRRQVDGSLLDFGDCFDANLGLDVPVSEERKRRTQVCLQLLERLTSSPAGHKLASTHWEQALRVAHGELAAGVSLLGEAKRLGPSELSTCKPKLETFVHGLGEYVRVSRSIVSTVGDLLLLDSSAMYTIDTLASSWCNLALLELALGIEQQWRDIEGLAAHLHLASKQATNHRLEAVEEIRQRAKEAGTGQQLCEFTLQPVAAKPAPQETLTKSAVHWRQRSYMACAANFLQSKCSFYIVEP